MRIEEEHLDVFQNIEFAVATVYRATPEMTDHAALRAYEALIEVYSAERANRPPRDWKPTAVELEVFDAAKHMCEWRLGRAPLGEDQPPTELMDNPIDMETLLRCLKRLRQSVQKWTRHNGRRGYLDFMTPYVIRTPPPGASDDNV